MMIGFRFKPTDEEIVGHYLALKLQGQDSLVDDIVLEIDHLCRYDPWELPQLLPAGSDDQVWYFFCRLDHKNQNRNRFERTTKNGFWKPTGEVRSVKEDGKVIGKKRILVFHYKGGRDSQPIKTPWVIHEYLANISSGTQNPLVLCKLKNKEDEVTENLPGHDEGEPSNRMPAFVENAEAQAASTEIDVGSVLQLLLQDETVRATNCSPTQGLSLDDLLANCPNDSFNDRRSQFDTLAKEVTNHSPAQGFSNMDIFGNFLNNQCQPSASGWRFQSDNVESDPERWADSILVDPDSDTEVCHEELYLQGGGASSNPYGHANSVGHRQMQTVQAFTEALPSSLLTGQGRNVCVQEMEVSSIPESVGIQEMEVSSMPEINVLTRVPAIEYYAGSTRVSTTPPRYKAKAYSVGRRLRVPEKPKEPEKFRRTVRILSTLSSEVQQDYKTEISRLPARLSPIETDSARQRSASPEPLLGSSFYPLMTHTPVYQPTSEQPSAKHFQMSREIYKRASKAERPKPPPPQATQPTKRHGQLRSDYSSGNHSKDPVIRLETLPSSHGTSPPTVYIVNFFVALIFFIAIFMDMLLRH